MRNNHRFFSLLCLSCLSSAWLCAATPNESISTHRATADSAALPKPGDNTVLFATKPGQIPYRIPAVAKAFNGNLLAISDYRPCGADIGYGRVDIHARISTDNGKTWGKEFAIAEGNGKAGAVDCGYGDAAVVADSESDSILLISVCGNTVYAAASTTRQNPNRVARFYSTDNGKTWSKPQEITEDIYTLFDNSKLGPVQSLFYGSGRICQSRRVKVGSHFRIYAALCARPNGNRVVYSDDFGKTWKALGNVDISPVPAGDEPKCEELPDGSVVISSRIMGGRFFNIYRYSNVETGEGSWGKAAQSVASNKGTTATSNATNGEILIIPAKRNSNGSTIELALQSVPLGPGRANVGIYYKELPNKASYASPEAFASNWSGPLQVSKLGSAYSTMIMQADGKVAFLYEESTYGADYTTRYKAISIEEITGGEFSFQKTAK